MSYNDDIEALSMCFLIYHIKVHFVYNNFDIVLG